MVLLMPLLVAASMMVPGESRVAAEDDLTKMVHAKEWSGTATVECNQVFRDETTTLIVKRSFGFSLALGPRQSMVAGDQTIACWSSNEAATIEGIIDDRREGKDLEGKLGDIITESGKMGGPLKWGPAQLIVNPQTKEYRLIVNPQYCDLRKVHKFLNNEWITDLDETRPGGASPLVRTDALKLPTSGTQLTGTTVVSEVYGSELNFGMTEKITYAVKWSLNPTGSPPEFVLDTGSFKDYIPNDDSGKVLIRSTKPDGAPALIRVTVSGISHEPGTCMNSADAGTGPDMEVLATENPEFDAPSAKDGAITVQTKKEVRTATLSIRCRDYGAYATVRAEAKIKGEWKPVKVLGSEATTSSFPLDENNNKIADAWEKNVENKDPRADDDKSYGNTTDGDGLTLYEEYRGLMVKGKHQCLDPNRKELFVFNKVGDKIRPGLALFEKATNIRVIELNADEMDSDRVVNFRKCTVASGGSQHGLILQYGDTGIGISRQVAKGGPTALAKSPGDCIEIDFAQNFGAQGAAEAAADTAHEIGHACGLKHHGDNVDVTLESSLYSAQGDFVIPVGRSDYVVFDAQGREITRRPLTLPKGARPMFGPARESVECGDVKCVMCYQGNFQYAFRVNGGVRQIAAVPTTKVVCDRFCSSVKGTGYNDGDAKPWGLFGDALIGRGNCLGRIHLKDW